MANWVSAHSGIAPSGYQKKKAEGSYSGKRGLKGPDNRHWSPALKAYVKPSMLTKGGKPSVTDEALRRLYKWLTGEQHVPGSKRK